MNSKNYRNRKIFILIFLTIVTGLVATFYPSLARIQNRTSVTTATLWDGTTASSYRKGNGTESDPYVIATGGELAYFAEMLKNTNYEGKYFTLQNDIILNNGIFSYDDGIIYTLNKSNFYLKDYTTDFYDNKTFEGVKIGSINALSSLDNFKGHLDGNSHAIYGLYVQSNLEEAGLFTNLQGNISNLLIKNALVKGGNIAGGLASTAKNSSLKNVSYEGIVVGNNEVKRSDLTSELANIHLESDNSTTINLNTIHAGLNGLIINETMTGTCTNNFQINESEIECQNGEFSTEVTNETLELLSSDTQELTSIKVKTSYDLGTSGGLIGYAENVTLENVYSKTIVKSSLIAGGLIGVAESNVSIERAYNTKTVEAPKIKASLIGQIENLTFASHISNAYSTTSNSIIGNVSNSNQYLSLERVINANTTSKIIESTNNSQINLQNVYTISDVTHDNVELNGNISKITLEDLNSKDTLISYGFNEFKDPEDVKTNKNNAWIYESGNLPILYTDDIKNPIATLNVSTYSWNNLGFDSNRINFNKSIAFSVSEISNTRPIKNAYYYISKSEVPLTRDEIVAIDTWTPYENITPLTEEGIYCIYIKIEDSSNLVSYINSDILVIDTSESSVTLKNSSKEWSGLNANPEYLFIDSEENFQIDATDSLSGVKSIEYHVASAKIDEENLSSITWLSYEDNISISYLGTHIIYVKVTDNAGNTKIINSDYIVYTGFTLDTVLLGERKKEYSKNITDKSSLYYVFTYNDTIAYNETNTHNIVTNKPLPIGTRITLKDKNDTFTYTVNSEKTVYPFKDFTLLGKASMMVYYEEKHQETIDEAFTIKLDFKGSSITENIEDLTLSLEIRDDQNKTVRKTIKNTLKSINIYKDLSATPKITASYNEEGIQYNSDSIEKVEITSKIINPTLDDTTIIDTSLDDMKLGISIKLVDEENNTVEKEHLKNIQFKIGDNYYTPSKDGITRISVRDTIDDTISDLLVITSKTKSTLENGTYYLKINAFAAYDGLYETIKDPEEISIPVYVQNDYVDNSYSFDIKTKEDYKVLFKNDKQKELQFNIIQNGEYANPNIRVSLYQKNKLTAYDQTYKLIDLNAYANTELESVLDKVYYAVKNPNTSNDFDLMLNLDAFKPGGYKLVFELFKGNKRVGTIEKKFIIR